jgi:hypothetical protein
VESLQPGTIRRLMTNQSFVFMKIVGRKTPMQ